MAHAFHHAFRVRAHCYPEGWAATRKSAVLVQHMKASEQAQDSISPAKINVTIKSPVGDISVVTLIRTDTTLDHSQKAEKVYKQCLTHHSFQLHRKNDHAIDWAHTSLHRNSWKSLSCHATRSSKQQRLQSNRLMASILHNARTRQHHISITAALCWQSLASKLPLEKFCYG